MSKTVLIIIGIIIVLMGIAGLIPSWTWASEPAWHAIAKIVIGAVAVVVGLMDKNKSAVE